MGRNFYIGTSLLALEILAQPVMAQQAPQLIAGEQDRGASLEDIVVTAQRRSERLQDVPVAVTAISAAMLDSKGIDDPTKLAVVTPGLTYPTSAASASPRIRGIGSAISIGGNENSVATYIDGVYIASSAGSILSLSNVSQVSVLKGPQGTLFGRNATGGLIQITTSDPSDIFSGRVEATIGNRDTYGGKAYVTGGLAENLAADFAVYFNDQQDGFGKNLTTGKDVGYSKNLTLRSKVKLSAGPNTTFTIAGDYSRIDTGQPAGHPVYGSLPSTGVRFTGGAFDSIAGFDPSSRFRGGGGSLTAKQDLGELSLVSITAYRRSRFRTRFDVDRLPIFVNNGDVTVADHQFSQELQLTSPQQGKLRWVLGGYYFKGSGAYDPLILFGPANTVFANSKQETTSYAAFGQATYDLLSHTNLTVGLRYTDEDKTYRGRGRIVLVSGVVINPPTVAGSAKAKKLTWRVALDHHFDDDVLGYVSFNRGFKSGGFNPQVVTAPLSSFKPEVLDALETGLKSDLFDRKLRINGAAFYYNYKNIQLNAFQNGVGTIYNAAKSKIYGVDLEVMAIPVRKLELTMGLSVLHGRYGDLPGAVLSTPRVPNGTTILGGNLIGQGNAKGNRLSYTPDWTINFGAHYDIDLSQGSLALDANFFHSDGFVGEADNRLRQKPYNLLNGSATFSFGGDKQYLVKVWGKNISNTAYAQQILAQATTDIVVVADGRTFGVTFGVKF
jgi:iron complex outermembrane receptor protein